MDGEISLFLTFRSFENYGRSSVEKAVTPKFSGRNQTKLCLQPTIPLPCLQFITTCFRIDWVDNSSGRSNDLIAMVYENSAAYGNTAISALNGGAVTRTNVGSEINDILYSTYVMEQQLGNDSMLTSFSSSYRY